MRYRLVTAGVVLMAFAGFAAASGQSPTHEVVATGGLVHSLMAAPVTGEPYSAMQTTELVRTLADGTKITRHGHHFVARDSQGRTRIERTLVKATNGRPPIKLVFVIDPFQHTLTTWVVGGKGQRVAVVARLKDKKNVSPATRQPQPRSQRDSSRPQPVVTREDLGMQVVDNLPATGERTTIVVPAGRFGNDQPITRTHEVWTSDEMKLVLLQNWTDPRTGMRTTQLEKFTRAEPDPVLFRPPAGYEIKTMEQTLRELAQKLEAAADAQE